MTSGNPTSIRINDETELAVAEIVVETMTRRSLVLRAMITVALEHKDEVIALIRRQL